MVLERESVLAALHAAVDEARRGRGSVVLVTGEAGIGKTSVVRAFADALTGVRLLRGACDDLFSARALGPLRDAFGDLTSGEAVVEELSRPTVLIIDDLHWADAATLDVLGYVARRIATLPSVLVLTSRDDVDLPARRLLLGPLSPSAVEALAAGSGWDPSELWSLTGGNPFYVTEVLAAPADHTVPRTVADAVVARMLRLPDRGRWAAEQLSVVPGTVDLALAEHLVGDLDLLSPGMLWICPDGVAYRHELARRAVELRLPIIRRRRLHHEVLSVLSQRAPDLARLVHHAVGAGDGDAVARYAPAAGREAAAAGAHPEALAHFAATLPYQDRLSLAARARLADDYGWELYNAHRFAEAASAGERAVRLYRVLGNEAAAGRAQVRLSRHYYMTGETERAFAAAQAAVRVLELVASPVAKAFGATYHGLLLALSGDPGEAFAVLRQAESYGRAAGETELVSLSIAYQGVAAPELDISQRIGLLREGLDLALLNGHNESAARAYANLAELHYRYSRLDDLAECVSTGLTFVRDRGIWSHAYALEVHRCMLLMRRGDWDAAQHGFAALMDRDDDPGLDEVYGEPPYARLLARRGAGSDRFARLWQRGKQQRSLVGLGYPGAALAEWAFLTGQPALASDVYSVWCANRDRPAAAPLFGEVLRYCARAGLPVSAFPDCPEPWASGLRGDWEAAADGWARLGDPYERALELAESGQVEPTLEALRILDDLGAVAPAAIVRRRLKKLGLRAVPRQPSDGRCGPVGLTARQVDVLELIAEGRTNAEIAERLVVSVRTVDHHVSAILAKLDVRTRREAARLLTNCLAG